MSSVFISDWLSVVNKYFRNLWSKRNKLVIDWERSQGITKTEKRSHKRSKSQIRERNKRMTTGKRFTPRLCVSDEFYFRFARKHGLTASRYPFGLE